IAQAVSGVATFPGLTLNNLGNGYTILASSGSLAGATTASFNGANIPATQLKVTSQPTTAITVNTGFTLVVTALDASGNPVPSFRGNVPLALASNPAGGTLGGPLTVAAVGGIATFSSLSLNLAGSYTIQASGGGLTAGTTG